MIKDRGWFTPFQDRRDTVRILQKQAQTYVPEVVKRIPRHRTVIQAGGNVGIYPFHLSKHFDRVVTFEPHAGNLECLRMNLENRNVNNVISFPDALGKDIKEIGLELDELNIGKHHVDQSGAGTDMLMIDALIEPGTDLIWIDIEGMEKLALEGAIKHINEYRPWIAFEENRRANVHLNYDPVPASEFLKTLGYSEVMKMDHDFLYRPDDG